MNGRDVCVALAILALGVGAAVWLMPITAAHTPGWIPPFYAPPRPPGYDRSPGVGNGVAPALVGVVIVMACLLLWALYDTLGRCAPVRLRRRKQRRD